MVREIIHTHMCMHTMYTSPIYYASSSWNQESVANKKMALAAFPELARKNVHEHVKT